MKASVFGLDKAGALQDASYLAGAFDFWDPMASKVGCLQGKLSRAVATEASNSLMPPLA